MGTDGEGGPRTYLGFDYGLRRIGVAVGQEITGTAAPLTTLVARDGEPDWTALDRVFETWRPAAVIVGVPLTDDDESHAIVRACQNFAAALRDRYGVSLYTVDERLSSREARQRGIALRQAGRRTPVRKGELDRIAAQVILQAWLDDTAGANNDTDP